MWSHIVNSLKKWSHRQLPVCLKKLTVRTVIQEFGLSTQDTTSIQAYLKMHHLYHDIKFLSGTVPSLPRSPQKTSQITSVRQSRAKCPLYPTCSVKYFGEEDIHWPALHYTIRAAHCITRTAPSSNEKKTAYSVPYGQYTVLHVLHHGPMTRGQHTLYHTGSTLHHTLYGTINQ